MKIFSIGSYSFAPKMVFVLLTLIVMGLFNTLGIWQLHRADEKKVMLSNALARKKMSPILIRNKNESIENYQPIAAKGIYDSRHVFLLDNQFYQHQLGYEVIEPMQISGRIILVSLGWVRAPLDRQQLPVLILPKGKKEIQGTAYFPVRSSFVLGENVDKMKGVEHKNWPKRIERMDMLAIEQWLKMPVYPFILRLSPDQKLNSLFVRDWPIVTLSPERHVGYAIQWFAMEFAVFIIFLGLNIKK